MGGLADVVSALEIGTLLDRGWPDYDYPCERFPALDTLVDEDYPSENMSSLSFRLRYGAFDYYTGGDLTGIPNVGHPDWQNMKKRSRTRSAR